VLSNESVQSKYCQAEFDEARRLVKQIITIQARDRTKLSGELADIQYVDMKNGVDDPDALAGLSGALERQLGLAKRLRPFSRRRTPKPVDDPPPERSASAPEVDTPTLQVLRVKIEEEQAWWRDPRFLIGSLLVPVVLAVVALLASGGGNAPPAISSVASETPMLDVPQIVGTLDAQAASDQSTANAAASVVAQATDFAVGTKSIANQTATATLWTATPSPNMTASIEAYRTQQAQTAIAVAAAWTAIPTLPPTNTVVPPTNTVVPPSTPTPVPTSLPTQDVNGFQVMVRVTASNTVNVRNGPGTNYGVIDSAEPGSSYVLLEERDGWYRISSEGWVSAQFADRTVVRTPVVQNFGGIPMAKVPAGCFMMGNNDGSDSEKPAHQQCFDAPFWIGQTEVTNAQYAAFIDAGGYTNAAYWTVQGWAWQQSESVTQPSCWTESKFNQSDQPVVCVSWYEATAYSAWLRSTSGLAFRLPTEAEWEYAARGPDALIYPWGNTWNPDNVVWSGNADGHPAPVGSRSSGASWVGALDMSGNVWEWVSSQYQPYPYSAADDREDVQADARRVVRGGSWNDLLDFARASFRVDLSPSDRYYFFGFRVSRPLQNH
jgi:formylglycine-generating enzyme required for sulfatase activity